MGKMSTELLEAMVIGVGMMTVLWTIESIMLSIGMIIVYILAFYIQHTWKRKIEDLKHGFDFILRPAQNDGILLGSILLPLSMISSTHSTTTPHQCITPELTQVNCLALPSVLFSGICLLYVWFSECRMSVVELDRLISVRWVIVMMSVMVALHRVAVPGVVVSAVMIGGSIICVWYLYGLLYVFEDSFTIGEAMVVAQGLTAITLEAVNQSNYQGNGREIIACLQVLVLGGVIIGLLMKPLLRKMDTVYAANIRKGKHNEHQNGSNVYNRIQDIPRPFSWKYTVYFYLSLAAIIILVLLPWLGYSIRSWPLIFAVEFIFMASDKRIWLVLIWAALISTAITLVFCLQTSSTVTRKYFHLFTVVAFIPGIYCDLELVVLATAGTFFIAVLLEFLRIYQVWPLGDALQSASETLGDCQDTGVIFLSHLYLLSGLAIPVWLYTGIHGYIIDSTLPLYSGVLSLGIGDTAASVVGSQFGSVRWPGTKKTVEGTMAAIVFQILACSLLSYIGILPSMTTHWLYISWTIVLTSLLEAFTSQIDNLVLPLFMFCLLVRTVT